MNEFNFQMYNTLEWSVIATLFVLFFIQLYFIIRYFFKIRRLKPVPQSIFERHISVIIPVRNGEETIKEIVEKTLAQQYSNFEVIIVDDNSQDSTVDILSLLSRKYPNVKHTGVLDDIRFAEKMIINLGLKASKSEWVVFLKPYKKEMSLDWLQGLNSMADDDTDAVIAYTNIKRQKGMSSLFFRMEKYWQYWQGAVLTLNGRTFITDQENVLLRRTVYFESGGFRQHINKYRANLELMLNEKLKNERIQFTSGNTGSISLNKEVHWSSFSGLVKKNLQIRKNLPTSTRLCLLLDEYSRLALIAAFTTIFILVPLYWQAFVALCAIHLILVFVVLRISQKNLKERKIFLSSLAYILFRPFFLIILSMKLFTKDRRNRWI